MKRIFCFFVILILFLSFPVIAFSYSAKSLVLYEPESKTFLERVNSEQRLPMASTTKIMTALVVLNTASLDDKVTVTAAAANVEGSSMYLKAGETLTVLDLLHGLMLSSGNDAATALAIHIGGSVDGFAKLMNARAKALGLVNTNFTNPSGLPDDEHYTTATDLALIAAAALENPVFAKIVALRQATVAGRTLVNHNKLLSMYDGAVGIKTGFTKKAGRCLVSAAKKDGVTLICVTLNAPDDWNDHITALDSGFERVRRAPLSNVSVPLVTPDGNTVYAKNRSTLYAVTVDSHTVTYKIFADNFVYAPKSIGDKVGTVTYYADGKPLATDDLVITQSLVAEVKKDLLISRLINFIKIYLKRNTDGRTCKTSKILG